MKIFNTRIGLLCLVLTLLSSGASAWTVTESFENQSLGQRCTPFWTGDGSNISVTNLQSATGTNACKFTVGKGGTAFGSGFVTPALFRNGDEAWVRFRLFMPQSFIYGAFSQGNLQKFVRFVTRASLGGTGTGYLDWYWTQEGIVPPYQEILEHDDVWQLFGTSADKPQRGVWETYEMYVKFDAVSVTKGGTGRVRAWKNGVLIGEMNNRPTLNNATHIAEAIMIFSYWNGGSPAAQELYFDDLVATNVTPGAVDSKGNPYIGVGQFVSQAKTPPLPPSSIH